MLLRRLKQFEVIMYFGPVASFTASGVLFSLGAGTLKNVRSKKEILFASFPALFAVQQAIEGILWLALHDGKPEAFLHRLTLIYLLFAILGNPVHAAPLSCQIRYESHVPGAWYFTLVYVVATILPYFISSHRAILIFGIPNLIFCMIAYAFYHFAFTSVWCFFAAVLSANLYIFLRKLHHQPVLPAAAVIPLRKGLPHRRGPGHSL